MLVTQKTYDLNRFLQAQQRQYAQALREIQAGYKASHWIWFIFPQLRGLGKSSMSDHYGISGYEEARAYMEHPVLGQRLLEISAALLEHYDKKPESVFGPIDAKKVRSCMTLFRAVAPEYAVFDEILTVFYNGKPDYRTLQMLGQYD